jgi:transcriptional regulator with XRE-family HTH domain
MGYRIKEEREKKRMTQQELAEKANISRTTVAMLEANLSTNTTTKTLAKIASALDTTVENLFFADVVQSAEQRD